MMKEFDRTQAKARMYTLLSEFEPLPLSVHLPIQVFNE